MTSLDPVAIRAQSFPAGIRGYDRAEVSVFLDEIARAVSSPAIASGAELADQIRSQTFGTALRGWDRDGVDHYLKQLAAAVASEPTAEVATSIVETEPVESGSPVPVAAVPIAAAATGVAAAVRPPEAAELSSELPSDAPAPDLTPSVSPAPEPVSVPTAEVPTAPAPPAESTKPPEGARSAPRSPGVRSFRVEQDSAALQDLDSAAWVSPSAQLFGQISLGVGSSVWPNVVARAEMAEIRIGRLTNIQDFVMIHVGYDTPTVIGDFCSITHHVTIHGATIEDECLIGIGATIMDGAVIGRGSIVGGGAFVPEGKVYPPNSIILGSPAKVKTERDSRRANRLNAWLYHRNAEHYARGEHRAWDGPEFAAWMKLVQAEIEQDLDIDRVP